MPRRDLPPLGYWFDVKFYEQGTQTTFVPDEEPDASFQEVSGIGVEYQVQEVPEGSNTSVAKLPKKPVFQDLVLKRGILLKSPVLEWVFALLENSAMEVKLLDVEVSLKNEVGEPLVSFWFYKAWPKKWDISSFNAMESSVVIESLALSYEFFKPKYP